MAEPRQDGAKPIIKVGEHGGGGGKGLAALACSVDQRARRLDTCPQLCNAETVRSGWKGVVLTKKN